MTGAAGAGLKGALGKGTVKQSLGQYFGIPTGGAAQAPQPTLQYRTNMTDSELLRAFPAVDGAPGVAATTQSPGMMASILGFAQKNPQVVQGIAGGVADVIGSAQERAVAERRLQLEEQAMRQDAERKARLAQLVMPMYQYEVSRFGGGR
jgi:hypothetical protein